MDDEEFEVYLADPKYQVENLKMLIASVKADLAREDEDAMVARSTEAWLLNLRENLAGVEEDTVEALEARRELARLLVEEISVARGEDGRPRVGINYRFGPPAGERQLVTNLSADGLRNSEEFSKAHGRGGSEGLLRGHPRMSSYEVAVEREPEAHGSD